MKNRTRLALLLVTLSSVVSFAQNAAEQAGKSSGMDMAGVMASIIGAATMAPPCMAQPPCQACCVMMAQALAQIPASSGSSSGAQSAGKAMSVSGTNNSTDTLAGQNLPRGIDAKLLDQYNRTKNSLKQSGISINGDSVTLPGGKSYSLKSDTSAAGLAGMGFPKSEIDRALALADKANKETAGLVKAQDSSGEATGSGGSGSGTSTASVAQTAGAPKRVTPSLAGMAKRVGDDRVGVSADNIFGMITRRYKNEDTVEQFMKN